MSHWNTSQSHACWWISRRNSSATLSLVLKFTASDAPREASSMAIARPMPRDAPVMRAILPSSFRSTNILVSGSTAMAAISSLPSLVHRFKNCGNTLSAADAHAHQRVTAANPPQLMQGFHREDRAAGSDRMTERDPAPIGVGFIQRQVQFPLNGQELCGKCLVEFN